MPFGEDPEFSPVRQGGNVVENLFWKGEKIHDLSHTGTGNAHVSGYFGLGKGSVLGQHTLPLKRGLNRIHDLGNGGGCGLATP